MQLWHSQLSRTLCSSHRPYNTSVLSSRKLPVIILSVYCCDHADSGTILTAQKWLKEMLWLHFSSHIVVLIRSLKKNKLKCQSTHCHLQYHPFHQALLFFSPRMCFLETVINLFSSLLVMACIGMMFTPALLFHFPFNVWLSTFYKCIPFSYQLITWLEGPKKCFTKVFILVTVIVRWG